MICPIGVSVSICRRRDAMQNAVVAIAAIIISIAVESVVRNETFRIIPREDTLPAWRNRYSCFRVERIGDHFSSVIRPT